MTVPGRNRILDGFSKYRHEVLNQGWVKGLTVGDVKEYLANLSEARFGSLLYTRSHHRPYIQPRGGFPTIQQQRNLSKALDEAGADLIPLTIDSYTRNNDYDKAGYLLQRSEEEGKSYLNGYPLVNQGYELTRGLYDDVEKPVCLRHGTPDARLLVETAIASGITEIEGGALGYCLPYSESFPIDRAILYWQYVDRACEDYSTVERPIHRESFGPLTATMVPPMMVVAIQVVELLLAAEQGVKSFGVSFGQTGSLQQDVALGNVLIKKSRHYLDLFGFNDVNVCLVYHQWMGPFPQDPDKASALISMSTMIAQLIAADKVVIKTKGEALGVPTIEQNCESVNHVRYILEKMPLQERIDNSDIRQEIELISSEADTILETIFDLPGDAFWESIYQAVRRGLLDVPYSPHRMNSNKLITLRDANLGIRVEDPGLVPIQKSDLELESQLLHDTSKSHVEIIDKLVSDINVMI